MSSTSPINCERFVWFPSSRSSPRKTRSRLVFQIFDWLRDTYSDTQWIALQIYVKHKNRNFYKLYSSLDFCQKHNIFFFSIFGYPFLFQFLWLYEYFSSLWSSTQQCCNGNILLLFCSYYEWSCPCCYRITRFLICCTTFFEMSFFSQLC